MSKYEQTIKWHTMQYLQLQCGKANCARPGASVRRRACGLRQHIPARSPASQLLVFWFTHLLRKAVNPSPIIEANLFTAGPRSPCDVARILILIFPPSSFHDLLFFCSNTTSRDQPAHPSLLPAKQPHPPTSSPELFRLSISKYLARRELRPDNLLWRSSRQTVRRFLEGEG